MLGCGDGRAQVPGHDRPARTSTQRASGVVDERNVWVLVNPYDGKSTQVITQCRSKAGGTDLQLAAFIDKEIAIRLATGQTIRRFRSAQSPRQEK